MDNYTELQDAIADWLNRVGSPELAARAPDFIKMAEARFNRKLRVRQNEKRASAILDAGFITLPSDWLEAKALRLIIDGKPVPLELGTPEQLDLARRDAAALPSGLRQPYLYRFIGNQIEVSPYVSGEATMELEYYYKVPALDTNSTNWLLQDWPDLYLYGALQHTAPYLRDDQRLQTWAGIYNTLWTELTEADDKAKHSGSILKTRTRRRS
jgi:hypothetical protein